jgi:hypothetical protein
VQRKVTIVVRSAVRLIAIFLLATSATAQSPSLDDAFHLMYNLRFGDARSEVAAYQQHHPDDPLADVADASAILFSEFARLRILETEFFSSDAKFDAREKQLPDPALQKEFVSALSRATQKANAHLSRNARDKDALFALSLLNGLRADYVSLIEKRDFAALSYTRTATEFAERLLAIDPDYYDAYVSTGLGKYIIGTKPAPVRWFLRIGGFKGDVDGGMRDLKRTAERGRYLAPFARLLLAVAYLRQHNRTEAKRILSALRDEFPGNPLFAIEVAKLDKP